MNSNSQQQQNIANSSSVLQAPPKRTDTKIHGKLGREDYEQMFSEHKTKIRYQELALKASDGHRHEDKDMKFAGNIFQSQMKKQDTCWTLFEMTEVEMARDDECDLSLFNFEQEQEEFDPDEDYQELSIQLFPDKKENTTKNDTEEGKPARPKIQQKEIEQYS